MIDWTSAGRAMKSDKLKWRQWITKHTLGICGVDTILMKWKQRRTPASCPRRRCNTCLAMQEWIGNKGMGETHSDTPRVEDQKENTPGTRWNYYRKPKPMRQHVTTDTIYITLPRNQGPSTTSRPSWMVSTTRRLPRYSMDMMCPTELLRMPSR